MLKFSRFVDIGRKLCRNFFVSSTYLLIYVEIFAFLRHRFYSMLQFLRFFDIALYQDTYSKSLKECYIDKIFTIFYLDTLQNANFLKLVKVFGRSMPMKLQSID